MSNNSVDQTLKQIGWTIKPEFLQEKKLKLDEMKKVLLDTDIKIFGDKSLPDMARSDQLGKTCIVQLHKTRNVTASKDNENTSHRSHLYRLVLTDGHIFQNALVLPSVRNFSLDTPPGVKLLLKPSTKVVAGFYILNDQTCEVLGGQVNELVQKWKLTRLMGKHVRTLMGEGAPPPWVPFGTRLNSATTVDTSQRAMDVAKGQQSTEEDPEFVRLRRAAVDQLVNQQRSKNQRFAQQDVMKATNVAKGFQQTNRKTPMERPNSAATASAVPKPANASAPAAAANRTNTRLPDWAKNQIADDDAPEEDNRRGRFGRQRRNDPTNEETKPTKDVTLFDFVSTKTSTQKPYSAKSSQISAAVQKQLFPYQNGDQVLARYHEDNEYYPAVIMNIMHNKQQCLVMFEGYESEETVRFDDIEPYEEGYYEEDYSEGQYPAQGYAYPPPQQQQQYYRNYHY